LPISTAGYFGTVLFTLFFCVFPDGRFVPPWARWVVLAWAVAWAPTYFLPDSPLSLDKASAPVILAYLLGFLIFGVAAQVYRYRRVSDPVQRQQTKWAVFGVAVAMGGFGVLLLAEGVFPELRRSGTLVYVATQQIFPVFTLFMPISIGVAMVRSRLYDVDVLINRTLVYGSLTVSLALVYLGSIVVLQFVFRYLTGENSQIVVVASTLVIAALFNPLRRRVQELVDRRFYRRKYDAARTLEAFATSLREKTDLENLAGELVAIVEQTIQPVHVSLWLRDREGRARMQKYR
jgi:hypothetical protein